MESSENLQTMYAEKLIAVFWGKTTSSHETNTEGCSQQNILGCISAFWEEHTRQLTTAL
jgi:hypothetical protein